MCSRPRLWGINGDSVEQVLQLGADETPLPYVVPAKGTYVPVGPDHDAVPQVRIAVSNDKRQVTGCPITSRNGDLVMMQVIWKGVTEQCHPKPSELLAPVPAAVVQHHSRSKFQTGDTWAQLLKKLDDEVAVRRQRYRLGERAPAILIIDNVASHSTSTLTRVRGVKSSPHLWSSNVCDISWIYVMVPVLFSIRTIPDYISGSAYQAGATA